MQFSYLINYIISILLQIVHLYTKNAYINTKRTNISITA